MPRAAPAGCDRTGPASTQRTIVIRAMQIFLDPKWLLSEARQHATQPLLELDLRLPAQHLPGSGDVGLATVRIVDGQRLVDDLALRRRHVDHCLRELANRKLVRPCGV